MKKIIFLSLAFLLNSCFGVVETLNDRNYIIENNTNHELVLKFYREGNLLDYLTTNLSENEKYKAKVRYENDSYLYNFPRRAFNSDSITIDFDNLKTRTYTLDFVDESFSEPINRNIFRHENYENLGNDNFLFLITEEDYNSAEDIN